VIFIENLTKNFGGKEVLKGVSFEVKKGTSVEIVSSLSYKFWD
jgi:ABC-type histidine transport system ATPase subunit